MSPQSHTLVIKLIRSPAPATFPGSWAAFQPSGIIRDTNVLFRDQKCQWGEVQCTRRPCGSWRIWRPLGGPRRETPKVIRRLQEGQGPLNPSFEVSLSAICQQDSVDSVTHRLENFDLRLLFFLSVASCVIYQPYKTMISILQLIISYWKQNFILDKTCFFSVRNLICDGCCFVQLYWLEMAPKCRRKDYLPQFFSAERLFLAKRIFFIKITSRFLSSNCTQISLPWGVKPQFIVLALK